MKNPTPCDYVLQLLLYTVRITAQEEAELSGLSPEQFDRLCAMPLMELHDFALVLCRQAVKVVFDRQLVDSAFAIQQRKRREQQQVLEFIEAGASYPIMATLFGLSKAEFSKVRRQLQMSEQDNGRFPLPDEATQVLVWQAWTAHGHLEDKARLLAVHRQTQVKVRAIWALLHNGLLSYSPTPPSESYQNHKDRLC